MTAPQKLSSLHSIGFSSVKRRLEGVTWMRMNALNQPLHPGLFRNRLRAEDSPSRW